MGILSVRVPGEGLSVFGCAARPVPRYRATEPSSRQVLLAGRQDAGREGVPEEGGSTLGASPLNAFASTPNGRRRRVA